MRSFAAGVVLVIAVVGAPRLAHATAFGSMFSGPTTADGASVLWNPGAMTLLHGTVGHLYGGASFIRLQYQRTTINPFTNQAYPQADLFTPKPDLLLGIVTDAGLKRFRFGLGFNIPVLDGAKWNTTYHGQPSSTRYFAIDARQAHFIIRPAVGFQINKYLSVGVGLDVTIVQIKHQAMTDFSAKVNQIACESSPSNCQIDAPLVRENPAFDALTTIDGLGLGVGVSGGLLVTPFPWLRIGASIASGARDVTVKSDLSVKLPQAVVDYVSSNFPSVTLPRLDAKGDISAHNPLTVALGVMAFPIPKLAIAVDWQWVQKSKMSTLYGKINSTTSTLITDQTLIKILSDDWLLGFRVSYQVLPWLKLGLRFEADPDTRPESYVTPVSIDFDKYQLTVGALFHATRWLDISVEYGRFFLVGRTVSQSNFAPDPHPTTEVAEGFDKPSPLGTYAGQVDRFAIGVSVGF